MQWIVEYDDDKQWITIASFGKIEWEHLRYYITPQTTSDGSQIQLKNTAQPYKWRIQQDFDSESVL